VGVIARDRAAQRRALRGELLLLAQEYRSKTGESFAIPPDGAPFIFLFTGESGNQYGYQDGWKDDDTFEYTGEGQRGPMEFVRGNRAIRDHVILSNSSSALFTASAVMSPQQSSCRRKDKPGRGSLGLRVAGKKQ
jgi:hypothetical protein